MTQHCFKERLDFLKGEFYIIESKKPDYEDVGLNKKDAAFILTLHILIRNDTCFIHKILIKVVKNMKKGIIFVPTLILFSNTIIYSESHIYRRFVFLFDFDAFYFTYIGLPV